MPTHWLSTWQGVNEIEWPVSRQDSRTFSLEDIMGEQVRALSLDSSQPGFQSQLYNVTSSSWFHFLRLRFFACKLRTVLFGSWPCYDNLIKKKKKQQLLSTQHRVGFNKRQGALLFSSLLFAWGPPEVKHPTGMDAPWF